jgi:hypothetical protein
VKRRNFAASLAALLAAPKALMSVKPQETTYIEFDEADQVHAHYTTRFPWGDTPEPEMWFDPETMDLNDGDQVHKYALFSSVVSDEERERVTRWLRS